MHRLQAARAGRDLVGRRARDALPEDVAVGPDELDAVAGGERALAADDADREQALALVGDRPARAGVDVEAAVDALAEPQPELERRRRVAARREAGAARLAGDDRAEHVLAAAGRDHGRDRRRGGELGGQHLAPHPAAAERGARRRARRAPTSAPSAIGSAPGVPGRARVDAVDLGQQHEQRGAGQHGDDRGERVVVAERDLVGRRRVVLVHDRHRAAREQLAQRVADVEVRGAVGDLGGGEQDLRAEQRPRGAARGPTRPGAAPGRAPRPPAARAARAAAVRARAGAGRARSRPDETTQTGVPPRTSSPISRARARRAALARTRPPGPATRLDPSLTTTGAHRCCVPSPTTRYWRSQRSRYVTGPRGPGVQSTLIPVSGAPVSSKPSAKRVGACQKPTVPRYASRNRSRRGLVLGDDPGGEARRLLVGDPHRLVERVDVARR